MLVLSGTVYIMLGCEDSAVSTCERNITAYKESVLPYQSAWGRFLSMWEFG